mgnify:CR=1 FL=1
MAERKLRIRGLKRTTWTVANSRQIGPDIDLKAWETRKRTQASDTGKIFVSVAGNDSNAGTRAAPKKTPQAAIDAAVAGGKTGVAFCDSTHQTYYCGQLDLKGISLYTDAGKTPTLSYATSSSGAFPAFGHPTGVSSGTRVIISYTYNGFSCLYAATTSGLYRSTNGTTWSLASASGNDITGACVWNGVLYFANKTTGVISSVSETGTVATFATLSQMGATGPINGGIWALGNRLYVDLASGTHDYAWYAAGTWTSEAGTRTAPFRRMIFDQGLAPSLAFACTTDAQLYTIDLSSSPLVFTMVALPGYQIRDMAVYGSVLYGVASSGILRLVSQYAPAVWAPVFGSGTTISDPQAFWIDEAGYYCAIHRDSALNAYLSISKDQGQTIALVSTSLGSLNVFCSVGLIGTAAVIAEASGIKAWDRRQIIDSTGASTTINGFVVDGLGVVVDQLPANTALQYSRCQRAHRPWPHEQKSFSCLNENSKFCDYLEVGEILSDDEVPTIVGFSWCEFYRIKGEGLRITSWYSEVWNCTFYKCGTALIFDTATSSSIFKILVFGSTDKDIVANAPITIQNSFFNSSSGKITATSCTSGDPLFVDASKADFRIKRRALGYAFDSGIPQDIGARLDTATESSPVYDLDYTLKINPTSITPSWNPAAYSQAFASDGSQYGQQTNSALYKSDKKLS